MTDGNMKVNIAGVEFKNPVIAASGTFGFGREYGEYYDIACLGGISVKGLTPEPRAGNAAPRVAETPSGMLNSVGLQNPGIDAFLAQELPALRAKDVVILANAAGRSVDEYVYMARRLSDSAVDMIELNISCPNVKQGGVAFGALPQSVYDVVSAVRKVCTKPLMVKLSPNTADITLTARAAEDAGADALSLINTLTGMAIDLDRRRPILANVTGGLSGPAVKPVALRMVYQAAHAVRIPVVGMGGIMTARDALEFLVCGARAIMVGTANFSDPFACPRIIEGIKDYCAQHHIADINALVNTLAV
ncbi:MAG: dihydroorotate dehydrogenase [Eubacteriales bacterium]|nr:dihydroorotate dehydrogenase [Eubacteriales bacterium]